MLVRQDESFASLTRFGIPLREAIAQDQDLLPLDDGTCDSGWCMT